MEDDFVVSGFKITGIVENRSGKHSLHDIQLILKREDDGESRLIVSHSGVERIESLSDGGRFEFRDIETGEYLLVLLRLFSYVASFFGIQSIPMGY